MPDSRGPPIQASETATAVMLVGVTADIKAELTTYVLLPWA